MERRAAVGPRGGRSLRADRPVRRDRDHRSHPDEARSARPGRRGWRRSGRRDFSVTAERFDAYLADIAAEARRAQRAVRPAGDSGRRNHAEPHPQQEELAHRRAEHHASTSAPISRPRTSCRRSAGRARSASPAIRIIGRRGGSRSARAICGTTASRLAELVDVWEAANRDDLFSVTSLKHYPYVANSDFHKPKHLYSWKTLLRCEKELGRDRARVARERRRRVDAVSQRFVGGLTQQSSSGRESLASDQLV